MARIAILATLAACANARFLAEVDDAPTILTV